MSLRELILIYNLMRATCHTETLYRANKIIFLNFLCKTDSRSVYGVKVHSIFSEDVVQKRGTILIGACPELESHRTIWIQGVPETNNKNANEVTDKINENETCEDSRDEPKSYWGTVELDLSWAQRVSK